VVLDDSSKPVEITIAGREYGLFITLSRKMSGVHHNPFHQNIPRGSIA